MAAPAFHAKANTADTSGTSAAITLPAYSAGDIVILLINLRGSSAPTPAASGWTLANPSDLQRAASAGDCTAVLYRVMTGSEGSSVTVSFSASMTHIIGHAISYSGVDTSSPIDGTIYVFHSTTSSGSFTVGPTATSGVDRTYVGLLGYQTNIAGNAATPSTGGVTERLDVQDETVVNAAIEELPAATAGNYSIAGTFTRSSARVLVGIALQPASGATVTGAAALTGAGSVVAGGAHIAVGQAALTGAGAAAAAGVRTRFGAAVVTAAGSLTASGFQTAAGTAALTGAGSLTAAGFQTAAGAAALTGAGSLTAAGGRVIYGTTTLAGVGSIIVSGASTQFGVVALTGIGSMTVAGAVTPAPHVIEGAIGEGFIVFALEGMFGRITDGRILTTSRGSIG